MTDTAKNETNIWKLNKIKVETSDIYTIHLDGADEKFAKRKAGQFTAISIMNPEGWSTPHPFTMSGAPEDELLTVTIKKVGPFTSAVKDLPPGSPLRCLGPLGNFCRNIDSASNIVMIGGGVGISPFLSVLRHFRCAGLSNQMRLFWINRTAEDTFARQEISGLTQLLNLAVVHCYSRESSVEKFFQPQFPKIAYEKGHLSADILRKHEIDKNASFYLCGPPPMMDAALVVLEDMQVPKSAIEQERFVWRGSPGQR